MFHRSRRIALLAALLALTVAPPAWAGQDPNALSLDEQARLDAGELVSRYMSRTKGSLRLVGGLSWQVIDAEPGIVWQALLDTTHYPRMMPQVLEARIVDDANDERTVFMRQGSEGLLEREYYLRVKLHEQRRDITFRIDDQRPHDLRAAWGFYTVRPYARGGTLLAYGVMADIGDGLLASALRGSVQEWMLKTPWMIKRFVEKSGRHIYR